MYRVIAVVALAFAAIVSGVSNSSAQPGGGKESPKQLEAAVNRLREQVKELEAKLSKTQDGAKKKDEKSPNPFGAGGFVPGGYWGGKGPGGKGAGGFGGSGPGANPLAKLDPEKLKRVLQIYELAYGKSETQKPTGDRKKGESEKQDGDRKKGESKEKAGDRKKGEFWKLDGDRKKSGAPEGKGWRFGDDKKKEAGKTPALGKGKGKGKGPGGSSDASRSIDSRIDRLIGELEQLRRELKKK